MLLLIDDINASYGLIVHSVVYSGNKFIVFGCVDSEERRSNQRRKRGCKSRHILLSPNPPSSEYLTMLGFEKRQPAVSRQSSLDGPTSTPLSVYHRFPRAGARNGRRPAGDIFFAHDLAGSVNWFTPEIGLETPFLELADISLVRGGKNDHAQ